MANYLDEIENLVPYCAVYIPSNVGPAFFKEFRNREEYLSEKESEIKPYIAGLTKAQAEMVVKRINGDKTPSLDGEIVQQFVPA